MMNAWTDSVDLYNKSLDNSNFAMEKNTVFMDSLDSKLKVLKTTYQEVAQNIINVDSLKNIVEDFTGFVSISGKVIEQIGLLNTIVFTLSSSFLMLNNNIKMFATEMGMMPWFVKTAVAEMGILRGTLFSLGVALDTAKLKVIALQATLSMGLSLIITGVISGVTKLIGSISEAKKKQEELIQTTMNHTQSLENEVNRLEALENKYKKLTKQKEKGKNVDSELLQVQRELATFSDNLVTGLDSEGKEISNNIKLTEKLIEEKKKLLQQEMESLKFKASQELPNIREDKKNLEQELKDINETLDNGGMVKEYTYEGAEILVDKTEELNNRRLEILSSLKDLISEEDKYLGIINKIIKKEDVLAIINSKSIQEAETRIKVLKDMGLTQDDINILIEKYKKETDNATESGEDFAGTQEDIEKINKELKKSFDDASNKLSDYRDILKELDKEEKISYDTKLKIIQDYPQLMAYLGDEKELRQQLIQAISEEKQTQEEAYSQMLMYSEEFYNAKIKGNEILVNTLGEYYNKDLENAKSLAEAKEKVENELIKNLSGKWAKYYNVLTTQYSKTLEDSLVKSAMSGSKEANEVLKAFKSFQDMEDRFNSITSDFGGVDFTPIDLDKSSSSKSQSKYISDLVTRYMHLEQAIENTKNEAEEYGRKIEEFETNYEGLKEIELRKQQIEVYKELQEQLEALNEERRKERRENANRLNDLGFKVKIDLENDVAYINNLERIKELTGDNAKEAEELIGSLGSLDDQIDSTKDEIYSYSQAISQSNREMAEFREEQRKIAEERSYELIKEYREELLDSVEDEIDYYEELKNKAEEVANAKIEDIEREISKLEERNDKIKEQEEREKRLQQIAEQKRRIANLKEQREVNVLKSDGDWEYITDPIELEKETNKLKDMEEDYEKWRRDLRYQSKIDRKRELIEEIRNELAEDKKKYDKKISNLRNFSSISKDLLVDNKDFNISNMEELKEALSELDSNMYDERLDKLKDFVSSYNRMMSRLSESVPYPSYSGGSGSSARDYRKNEREYKKNNDSEIRRIANDHGVDMGVASDMKKTNDRLGYKKYKTGGLVDYTGKAWVDGTPTKPEAFLNAEETKTIKDLAKHITSISKNTKLSTIMPKNFSNNLMKTNNNPSEVKQIFNNKLEFPNVTDGQGVINELKQYGRRVLQFQLQG